MNVGDLVMSKITGKVGIVVGIDERQEHRWNDYWLVMMHDSTYSIHTSKLKPLEVIHE
jgi:hypothetical protein